MICFLCLSPSEHWEQVSLSISWVRQNVLQFVICQHAPAWVDKRWEKLHSAKSGLIHTLSTAGALHTLTRVSLSKSYSKRLRCSCSTGGSSSYKSPILASCTPAKRSRHGS